MANDVSLQPLPSSSPSPSACPPPLWPSPLPCPPRPLRCPRATLIVITIALAALALALFIARQPRHHHHHPRCCLRRRHRCHHRPRRHRSPVTLVTIAQPSPSSSLLHATLIATAILLVVALALFVAHHPHCHHHRPFHPCPLCHCHHHPPHAIVVRRCPPSWSCGPLVDTLSPATARLCQSRCWLIVVRHLSPSPLLPLLARHPRCHCSCRHCHRPLCCMPPSSPTPWPVPPLPSSSTGTLIAVTIALAILTLFVTAITIRRTLSLYVVAHRRGRVVVVDALLPARKGRFVLTL
jgi:hypothetical protein